MISFPEARRLVLEAVRLQPATRLPLSGALGAVLAEPVESRDFIPPFDNAGMDGFAVRGADLDRLPAELRVIEEIQAGTLPTQVVRPGTCARIMTGAPFPAGADAVVPVEWTEAAGAPDRVRIGKAPSPGQYVRRAGADVEAGARVFEAGTLITPPIVGMLATLGYAEISVRTPPRVAVIATGDELVDVGQALTPGRIRNSNGPALAAQVVTAGGVPGPLLVARDDEAGLRSSLDEALAADVVLLSGGVSMGAYDLVRRVLDDRGLDLRFWKVNQRPGKPLAFGLLDGKPVFGLPGNPVSSAVCFEVYVRPALARMLGRRPEVRPLETALLAESVQKDAGLYHFIRGTLHPAADGRLHVRTTGAQASNLYSSFVRADCLIHLPEDLVHPAEGTPVRIERLSW